MIHIIFLYSNKRKVFYPQLLFFNLKKQGFPRFFQQQQSLRGSQQQLLLSPKRLITIITAMAIHTQSQLPPKIPPPVEQQQLLCITKTSFTVQIQYHTMKKVCFWLKLSVIFTSVSATASAALCTYICGNNHYGKKCYNCINQKFNKRKIKKPAYSANDGF